MVKTPIEQAITNRKVKQVMPTNTSKDELVSTMKTNLATG